MILHFIQISHLQFLHQISDSSFIIHRLIDLQPYRDASALTMPLIKMRP